MWKEWAVGVLERVYQIMPYVPLNNLFLFHLFRGGLVWQTAGIYHSAISAFLEPHHHCKAASHPIISE